MPVAVKICGLNSPEAVKAAVDNGASYTGFIFYSPSPRDISLEKAEELATLVPPSVKKVAVTVDATDAELADIIAALNPDFLQLHGDESIERITDIKKKFVLPVIKAIKVSKAEDIDSSANFAAANMLLFDTKAPLLKLPVSSGKLGWRLQGGTGLSFDWNLLKGRNFNLSWMLSGGLHKGNIEEAIKITDAKIVDISSGLETSPGKKSPELIEKFMRKIREL